MTAARVLPRPRVVPGWLAGLASVVLFYLVFPIFVIIPVSFSSATYLSFPPPGFSLQWYEGFFGSAQWRDAAWLSIWIGASGGKKRVDEPFALVRFEEGSREPGRLVGVPDGARLLEVSSPEYIVRRRALPIVAEAEAWNRLEQRWVPKPLGRQRADPRRRHDCEVPRRSGDPIEERAPDGLGLLPAESLEDH
jgi:hypothetical protein